MPAKKKKDDAAAAKETASPQTETNPELDEMIAAEKSENSDAEAASPQTGTEAEEKQQLPQKTASKGMIKVKSPRLTLQKRVMSLKQRLAEHIIPKMQMTAKYRLSI